MYGAEPPKYCSGELRMLGQELERSPGCWRLSQMSCSQGYIMIGVGSRMEEALKTHSQLGCASSL